MIERVQKFHQNGYLHRNIKPENFAFGKGNKESILYLLDFELSKKYLKNDKIIPFKRGKTMTSTLRYASINSQLGFEQSRRDDLESIGYLLVYFMKGELPWQNIPAKNKEELFKKILTLKLETSLGILTLGMPDEFKEYLSNVRSLQYEEEPNYSDLRFLFQKLFKK